MSAAIPCAGAGAGVGAGAGAALKALAKKGKKQRNSKEAGEEKKPALYADHVVTDVGSLSNSLQHYGRRGNRRLKKPIRLLVKRHHMAEFRAALFFQLFLRTTKEPVPDATIEELVTSAYMLAWGHWTKGNSSSAADVRMLRRSMKTLWDENTRQDKPLALFGTPIPRKFPGVDGELGAGPLQQLAKSSSISTTIKVWDWNLTRTPGLARQPLRRLLILFTSRRNR